MKATKAFLAAVGLALAIPAGATSHQSTVAFTEAEVRKVDRAAGKVTLRHGPIANLQMAPMTMVFHVEDRTMLDKVKSGDKVRFKAEKVRGSYTVTELVRRP